MEEQHDAGTETVVGRSPQWPLLLVGAAVIALVVAVAVGGRDHGSGTATEASADTTAPPTTTTTTTTTAPTATTADPSSTTVAPRLTDRSAETDLPPEVAAIELLVLRGGIGDALRVRLGDPVRLVAPELVGGLARRIDRVERSWSTPLGLLVATDRGGSWLVRPDRGDAIAFGVDAREVAAGDDVLWILDHDDVLRRWQSGLGLTRNLTLPATGRLVGTDGTDAVVQLERGDRQLVVGQDGPMAMVGDGFALVSSGAGRLVLRCVDPLDCALSLDRPTGVTAEVGRQSLALADDFHLVGLAPNGRFAAALLRTSGEATRLLTVDLLTGAFEPVGAVYDGSTDNVPLAFTADSEWLVAALGSSVLVASTTGDAVYLVDLGTDIAALHVLGPPGDEAG
jgi:hypothetical protein